MIKVIYFIVHMKEQPQTSLTLDDRVNSEMKSK